MLTITDFVRYSHGQRMDELNAHGIYEGETASGRLVYRLHGFWVLVRPRRRKIEGVSPLNYKPHLKELVNF